MTTTRPPPKPSQRLVSLTASMLHTRDMTKLITANCVRFAASHHTADVQTGGCDHRVPSARANAMLNAPHWAETRTDFAVLVAREDVGSLRAAVQRRAA